MQMPLPVQSCPFVTVEDLLRVDPTASLDGSPELRKTGHVHLVIQYIQPTIQGICIGYCIDDKPMVLLGRLLEFSCHASTHQGCGHGSFRVITNSLQSADILSLFHPLAHITYQPIDPTRATATDPHALLVPGTKRCWELHEDYEVVALRDGGTSLVLVLRNLKTKGVIDVPVTMELAQLIPHII